jgi:hypothetical protein
LVTKINAAEKRADFRHALTSYLDLVALERGAEVRADRALEAAAALGGGWAFQRIAAALDAARRAPRVLVGPGRASWPPDQCAEPPTWPTSPGGRAGKAPDHRHR